MLNLNLDFSNWLTYVYLQLVVVIVIGMSLSYMNYQPQTTLVWDEVVQNLDTYITVVTPMDNTPVDIVQNFFIYYDRKEFVSIDNDKLIFKIDNTTYIIYSKNTQQLLTFINTHRPEEIEIDVENNKVWVLFVKQ